jgi:hypothetical protein
MFRSMSLPMRSALLTATLFCCMIAAGIAFGWPGERDACAEPPYCFCEAARPGRVAQPANSWSTFAFVAVGIALALHNGRRRRDPATSGSPSAMLSDPRYAAFYAAVIVYMGPGSFFFHGTFTAWGGIADAISMHFFILYVLAYEVGRGWSLDFSRFRAIYLGLAGFFFVQRLIDVPVTQVVFGCLVTITLLLEVQLAIPLRRLPRWLALGRRRDVGGSRVWLLAALGFFLAAILIWRMSDSGRPWCVPDSLWQGHAAWHLLSALTAGSVYLYFCDERASVAS